MKFRIRRCDGNKAAWMLVLLRKDGTEHDSFGTYITAISVDALLKRDFVKRGDVIELVA